MLILILSWAIGALLTTSSVLIIVGAFIERRDSLCAPDCTDLPFIVAFAALGMFGAAVSVSISQLSKLRPTYVKRLIWAGGGIYLVASVASISFIGSSLTVVFIASAIAMMAMMTWVVSTWDSGSRQG